MHFRLVAHRFAGLGGRSRLHAYDGAEAQETDSDDEGLAHFHFLLALIFIRIASIFAQPRFAYMNCD